MGGLFGDGVCGRGGPVVSMGLSGLMIVSDRSAAISMVSRPVCTAA